MTRLEGTPGAPAGAPAPSGRPDPWRRVAWALSGATVAVALALAELSNVGAIHL